MDKNISKVIIFLSILAIAVIKIFGIKPPVQLLPTVTIQPTPTPKILKLIDHYEPPKIATASSYTLIFTGDSMTGALGENFDFLRADLTKYYPKKVFGLFNYGFGSTNILSLEDRLNHDTVNQGKNFPAILNRYFDIILIESSGNNPLSEFPLEVGLQKQTAALDQVVAELSDTHPNSLIIFIATVAPSSSYGKGVVDLSPQIRIQWANERRAYIENHISYAKKHNIPLINVYEKTLDKNGLTINKYINPSTYIHPSSAGVNLISQMIADYLYKNNILLN
ncbi:MAG: GDSL-type esterase/lipase family protein [Candidatus Shapirobacteria bacterium]|nr:GDSL-type esterase/lipase family protein [Candidatus Shapirobacteria bacterium]